MQFLFPVIHWIHGRWTGMEIEFKNAFIKKCQEKEGC
jgi:hypothetical protein